MAQLVLHSLHSAAHASAISCRARLGSAPQQTLARQHLRLFSAQIPGPIERKFREEFVNYSPPPEIDPTVIRPSPDGKKLYSAKIKRLADEISGLTLLETLDLTELMKHILGLGNMDLLLPFAPGGGGGGAGGGAPAAAAAPVAAEAPPPPPPKEEKTHVDIKLKAFDSKNKIKVIKEIRAVTSLGLKEAKELVESAPCTVMAKVKREDAAKIVEKLKAETGGEFELI